jgi:two-component system, OmpR family, sensor histidine kinase ArlS
LKIKFKITILFALLVTSILLLISLSVYYFSSLERVHTFNQRLKGRANNNAQIYSLFGKNDTSQAVLTKLDSASAFTLPRKSVVIFNYRDESVYTFNTIPGDSIVFDKEVLNEARLNKEVYFTSKDRDALAFHYVDTSTRIVVLVAGYDDDGWARLQQLREILWLSLFIGIAIVLVVGYVFSVQLVKPITRIIYEVKHISSQNLSWRIHEGESHDELNQLANTFNDLLNRLHISFTTQRRFISNASHELSTPLTSISSQLEVTLQKERNPEEYRQVLQSIQEDVQQMRQLTKSLLEIAKTGSEGTIELKEVRIDEVLIKVMGDVQKISPEYKVQLHFGDFPDNEKDFLVFGNVDLLYSSLRNIAENGCKYSADHLSLIDLQFEQQNVIVQVKNQGTVIALEEQENIFQPFYRISSASSVKGFGLGLALAKRIIALHKGTIQVQSDNMNGTVFTIVLPSIKAFATR